jgi:NTE family protein
MKTALVLGGGGAKGAFEVGALKVILKKIVPDAVFGTSVGSFNSAFLLSLDDIESGLVQLEELWLDADKSIFFPYNEDALLDIFKIKSVFSVRGLELSLKSFLGKKKFEDLLLPLYVKCTRLHDGSAVFFNKGDIIKPVLASCAVPPMFPSVKIRGVEYIDGGIEGSGLKKAEEMGFKQIILVNLNTPTKSLKGRSIHTMAAACLENMAYNLTKYEIDNVKKSKVIEIDIDPKYSLDLEDFEYTEELIKVGEKRAKEMIGKIKK